LYSRAHFGPSLPRCSSLLRCCSDRDVSGLASAPLRAAIPAPTGEGGPFWPHSQYNAKWPGCLRRLAKNRRSRERTVGRGPPPRSMVPLLIPPLSSALGAGRQRYALKRGRAGQIGVGPINQPQTGGGIRASQLSSERGVHGEPRRLLDRVASPGAPAKTPGAQIAKTARYGSDSAVPL
jgi:hypothetical protein